jgi:pimeloyl-ACP methyl ester carboxylesterase
VIRRPTQRALIVLVAVVAALLSGLVSVAAAYEIGHTSLTYTDADRGNRSVPTEIFYPADSPGEDVAVATPPAGGFPAVSFGHGFLIPWSDYDYLWEGLVPEGFIVLLPDTEGGLLPDHLDLGLDLAFILRELRDDSYDPGSLFYGTVSQAGAVAGHSMGGGASFLAASEDPGVTALVNLAAAETSPSAISAATAITVPSLIFSGSNDCVTPPETNQIPMYDALASDCRTRLTLLGASHCQFAEYNFTCSLGEGGCPSPTITRDVQHGLTIELIVPWLHYTLEDELWGWLEFEELLASSSDVTFETACDPTSVAESDAGDEDGRRVTLSACHPNPFCESTTLHYFVPRPCHVQASIYSVSGRRVAALSDGSTGPGWQTVRWDGRDQSGASVASGVYACVVTACGESDRRAVVLVR